MYGSPIAGTLSRALPMNTFRICRPVGIALLLAWPRFASAAPLFEDNFDTDTSGNWKTTVGYYDGTAADDFNVDFSFDYSTLKFKRYVAIDDAEPTESPIPPAPHSNGTTKGLKVTVNKKDAEAARFAVNLYPKGQSFSGDYVLKFDLFLNHSAYLDNGVGTTEYALFGINHGGDFANWFALSGAALRDDFKTTAVGRENSDGIFFGLTGDGGAARDAVSLQGGGPGQPPIPKMADSSGGISDRNNDGAIDSDDAEGYFANVFPAGKFEGVGVAGKRWIAVEISQIGNTVTWKIDGHIIAQRVNDTAFKSGTIMLGYSDPFSGIADPLDENYAIFDNVRVEPVRTVVVDTTDNESPAGDGKTSLKEALAGLQTNDQIKFNIAGDGPHVIKTPLGGYALITQDDVVIDGYSQPGASPNTKGVLEGNDAKLRIVLDSTGDDTTGDPDKPARRSTRLPYSGYGDSENAILGVLGADNVTIRGLCFASRHALGSDEDPSIYSIALVQGAENARVQGNWFGLQPDGKTIKGGGSAVSAYRFRVTVDGANTDTFSGGLIFGTDSDAVNDVGEGNITAGMHIGLALELPYNRVHGNYFNVLADGSTFLNVNDIYQAQLDAGREAGDSGVENYENGRQTDFTVIGTDGNGVNDANERNVFNTVKYDHLIEFYSNAQGCVIAGNYFGLGVDGKTVAPAIQDLEPDLAELPGGSSSFRLGTDGDGISDDLEGNHVAGVQGHSIIVSGASVLVTVRGNHFSGNGFDAFPFFDGSGRPYETYYADVLVTPTEPKPTITGLVNGVLSGKLPERKADAWPYYMIDVYVIDPLAEAKGNLIPGQYLGSLLDDSEADQAVGAGDFAFDISGLNPPGGSKLAIAVTYAKDQRTDDVTKKVYVVTESGRSVTGPLSDPVLIPGQPNSPINITKITRGSNNTATLTWTGGTAPFKVQSRDNVVSGAWTDVGTTTSDRSAVVTLSSGVAFLRIAGQ